MNRRTTALFYSVDMADAPWGKWLGGKYGPADDPAQVGVWALDIHVDDSYPC